MRVPHHLLLASLLSLAALPASACYTVYGEGNRIMYQSDKPPVDMSLPLHETLPKRFPGGQMVFDLSSECGVLSSVAIGAGGPITRTSSPLLTDESTARRIGAPHRMLDGVAVIAPSDVTMRPGVTVVPSTAVASKSPPDTTVLGGPGAVNKSR